MDPTTPSREGRAGSAMLKTGAVFLILAALVLVTHRVRNRSLIGAHGFLHSAVVYSVLDRSVPPENPFAAGAGLPYYWAFHVAAAALVRVLSLDPLHAFELLNLIGLALFVPAVAGLAGRLTGSHRRGWLAALLALVAVNPLGPVLLVARIVSGQVDLSPDASPALHTHPLRVALYWDDPRFCPNLIYFLNPSARALALGLAAVAIRFGLGVAGRPGAVRLAGLVTVGALLGAANPLFGIGGIAALAAAHLLLRVATRGVGRPGPGEGRAIAAVAAGVLLSAPTWVHLFAAASGGSGARFDATSLATAAVRLALSGGPLLVLAWLGTRESRRRGERGVNVLFVAGVMLLLAALGVRLPQRNELYFFSLAMLFLAVPAAGARFLRGPGGRTAPRAALLLLAVFLPATVLDLFSFWHRRPVEFQATPERITCTFWPERMPVHAWIHSATPADAILLDVAWPEEPPPPVHQNVSLVPAATRRHLYLDRPSYVIPDTAVVRRRFERMHRIFGGEVLDAADRAALMEDGRPVYVLCRQGDGLARVRRALGAGAETVYSDPRHAVVRVRP